MILQIAMLAASENCGVWGCGLAFGGGECLLGGGGYALVSGNGGSGWFADLGGGVYRTRAQGDMTS